MPHGTGKEIGLTIGVLVTAMIHVLPPEDHLPFVFVDADVRRTFLSAAVFIEEELQKAAAHRTTTPENRKRNVGLQCTILAFADFPLPVRFLGTT